MDGQGTRDGACAIVAPFIPFIVRRRGRQRGISPQQIELVVRFGRCYRGRQALVFFFGRQQRSRYQAVLGAIGDTLKGLVVVTTLDGRVVITAYHREHPPRVRRRGIHYRQPQAVAL